MAKIRYYKDPLIDKFEDIITNKKLLKDVLKSLKISDRPLSVSINGETSEELFLDYNIKKNDSIVIKRIVEGNSDNDSNKVLSSVIQIAAIVGSFFIPGSGILVSIGKAALVAGGSLIGGVVRVAGFSRPEPEIRESQKPAANAFSITSAQNEFRQMKPMKVVMGSHRVSPDFANQPFKDFVGGTKDLTTQTGISNWAARAINFSNESSDWRNVSANFLGSTFFNFYNYTSGQTANQLNFWPYPLQVSVTVSNSDITNQFVVLYEDGNSDPGRETFRFGTRSVVDISEINPNGGPDLNTVYKGPILIRHTDPLDPVVIANGGEPFISTLQLLAWSHLSQNSINGEDTFSLELTPRSSFHQNQSNYESLYLYLIGFNQSLDPDPSVNANPYRWMYDVMQLNVYESGFATIPLTPEQLDDSRDFYNLFGGGVTNTVAGIQNNPGSNIEFTVLGERARSIYIGRNPAAPGYNIGGDLLVFARNSRVSRKRQLDFFVQQQLNQQNRFLGFTQRFINQFETPRQERVHHFFHYGIGDVDVTDKRIGNTELSNYEFEDNNFLLKQPTEWSFAPTLSIGNFYSSVSIVEGAQLYNNDDFSGITGTSTLELNDSNNWIYRETPQNTREVWINMQGRSFASDTTNGGYERFFTEFEIQYRRDTDTIFSWLEGNLILGGDSPTLIRETLKYSFSDIPGKFIFRIRKKTKDPTDNETVSEFNLESLTFFELTDYKFISENREYIKLLSSTQNNGQTQRFNALVEARCQVKVGQNYVWTKTRNPAWWFLYFARGGFINPSANGALPPPFSPTVGWVNSADHPDNQERIFGAGFLDSQIDFEAIEDWAEFCENNNLFLDLVLESDSSSAEILEKIANIGRASVTFYQGSLSVTVEDPLDTPKGMYGMSNIITGSFTVDYITNDVPDKIIGYYSDRNADWETRQVEAQIPGSTDDLKISEISLEGVTEQQQAQREVNILAGRQLYQRRRYGWKASSDGILVQRGNLVYLSHDLTQYDFSGRVAEFEIIDKVVTRIRLPIRVDADISNAMIRLPNNEMKSYEVLVEDQKWLRFVTEFDLEDAPDSFKSDRDSNIFSRFGDTVPEDYLFFCGAQSSLGKIVRIDSIKEDSNGLYDIAAIEEEPALYSYEFDQTILEIEPQTKLRAVVEQVSYKDLGGGVVELWFQTNGAYAVQIVNEATSLPIISNSGATIFGSKVKLNLIENSTYNLVVEPVLIGSPYEKISKKIKVVTGG